MREISPAVNASSDDYLKTLPPELQILIQKIREEKHRGTRPLPSNTLIDQSSILSKDQRNQLLDTVASLVDENVSGRADMCIQFALLLEKAFKELKISARIVMGTAIYYSKEKEVFRWDHAWVRIEEEEEEEIIDGNTDILYENPMVPQTISIKPYWGPIKLIPNDRRLRDSREPPPSSDEDVDNIWWPDLKKNLINWKWIS